jgi:succinylglutamate desuccinylase
VGYGEPVTELAPSRIIAQLRGAEAGPTLIVIGGMHGNEPAGIVAAREALGGLDADAVRGEVIALIGNLRASTIGRRYIAHDLNRLWTAAQLAVARSGASAEPELHELAELATALDEAIARARGPVFVLDLHTTSAPGFPFAVVGPSAAHRQLAAAFPLPGIVGLEESLPGVLTGYLGQLGCVTLAIEGGQHTTSAAAENLAAVVTIALEVTGVVAAMPHSAAARAHLLAIRGELPHAIEVVVRHALRPDHAFRMEPGFANIQRIPAGTLLARDAAGDIHAPFDGVVLLPLYQPDGDDGFFYGRSLA